MLALRVTRRYAPHPGGIAWLPDSTNARALVERGVAELVGVQDPLIPEPGTGGCVVRRRAPDR